MACVRLYGPVVVVLVGWFVRAQIGWGVALVLIVAALGVALPVHVGEAKRRVGRRVRGR